MASFEKSWKERIQYVVAFCLILAFYAMTRPLNHAESYDSINYALFAENFELGTAPDSRNILFHAVNRVLFLTSEWLGFDFGALELISSFNILCGALSIVLFARLMKRRFEVSSFSAWTGAAFLGLTYGFWRYAGAAEVYIPSIFLILCSLTLILKFLDSERQSQATLIAASVLSGLAVLYYQPNVIVLFAAAFILFCSSWRIFAFIQYAAIGALVVVSGIVSTVYVINGAFPSVEEVTVFLTSRNGEFGGRPEVSVAIIKTVLAFGHDMFSAHWTRTLDPVRSALDPLIPGCVYNFNVVVYAGKGVQYLTVIAAALFLPVAFLFLRLHWLASSEWKLALPKNKTFFLLGWLGLMGAIVGTIDPGSFEAWIPVLVPFAGLLTIWVIEPCFQQGKQRVLIVFLVLLFLYNFFGGMMLWRNGQGDYFHYKTQWIRNELKADDTVLLNEFDYRLIDYLNYHCDARVVHLHGDDRITIFRSHPDIHSITLDEFMEEHQKGERRLFVMDDVLSPSPEIKSCRYGDDKFRAASALADRLKGNTVLVDSSDFGKTFEVKAKEQ